MHSIQYRWNEAAAKWRRRFVEETHDDEPCCGFTLSVLPADDAPNVLGPSGTNHIPIPSSWRGLRPDDFMWPALPRVSVFAVDFHAGSFFYLCTQWVRFLPYHFRLRYYTDYHFNYPLDYLKGVLPVTVDTHTLEQRGVLPWAGETSVDKFHQGFAAHDGGCSVLPRLGAAVPAVCAIRQAHHLVCLSPRFRLSWW